MGFQRNPSRTAYGNGHDVALTTVNIGALVVRAMADRCERHSWLKLKN